MTPIYHLQTANFNNIGSCKSNVQAWCSVPYSALLFLHKQKCRTVLAYSYMKKLCLLFTHAALSTICLNLGVHSHVIESKSTPETKDWRFPVQTSLNQASTYV